MSPRLLLLDIETEPALTYTWSLHEVTIGVDQIVSPGGVLCWAAKWVGKPQVTYRDKRGGMRQMLEPIHKALSEADAVITFNGERFDLPKLNGAFLLHGLPAIPQPTSIDLYKYTRKLGYLSNKLAFVAPLLGVGGKVKHAGFSLWVDCMNGKASAWKKMREYNIQDTALLEGLYEKLRPVIRNHPRLGGSKEQCPVCQSWNVQSRGVRRTRASVIARLNCQGCGSWFDGQRRAA